MYIDVYTHDCLICIVPTEAKSGCCILGPDFRWLRITMWGLGSKLQSSA